MDREERTDPGTVLSRPSTDAVEVLAGLGETVRAMRRRDAVTEGVPTFLLLEDARSASPGRPAAENRVLAGLARSILDRLARAPDTDSAADAIDAAGASGGNDRDHHPSLREKVPLTLEALGALRFAPDPEGPIPEDGAGLGRADGDPGPSAEVTAAFLDGRYVRAVNFHATPRRFAGRLEAQLSWLAERFAPVTYDDLLRLTNGDGWPYAKPPLILGFFDGRRDNFEVAAPVLERLGLVGWFFVVSGWVATPPEEQRDFALRNDIALSAHPPKTSDDRLAMTDEEVRALAGRGHVIACHTRSHATVSSDMALEEIEAEITGSKRDLERPLGDGSVRAFVWREGSPLGIDARADQALREAGYEILFANHTVQRVR